jgi:xylulokinase
MPVALGLDIGTTSTIGILIDTAGRTLALAAKPVDLHSPHPNWAEQDPEQWWANVVALVPELLRQSGLKPESIAAIGSTGMLPAVVLLNEAGGVLRRSIQQSDGRTGAEVDDLRRSVDEAVFLRRTGNGINQQLVAPKLRWIERHEPDLFRRIATVFGSYDYVNWRLTGIRGTERNWGLEAGFVDLGSGQAADDLVALAGISRSAIPSVRQPHEILGRVAPDAARSAGLAAGTPVVAGTADHVASAFVAGIAAPGDVLLKFGGSGDILLAASQPKPDPRLYLDYHLVPGLYVPNGCMAVSGTLLNWWVRTLGEDATVDGRSGHQRLDGLAANLPPGAGGLTMLPYFVGEKTPIHDPAARGTLVGLNLSHGKGHIWRAALEAVCLGLRHHVDVLNDLGYPLRRFVASDGGAASRVWMQIAADAMDRPVGLLKGHPGSCLGAAYVAAVGIKAIENWDAIGKFVAPADTVRPDPVRARAYDRVYDNYRDLYGRLRTFYPQLAS